MSSGLMCRARMSRKKYKDLKSKGLCIICRRKIKNGKVKCERCLLKSQLSVHSARLTRIERFIDNFLKQNETK